MTRVPTEAAAPPTVSAAWLLAHARDEGVRIVDLRWYLKGKRGADEYGAGHLPGAVFLDLESDLTAPAGPGRHPIPGAEQLTRAMRLAGVNAGDHVVVYDDAGGSIASRLWWLLRRHGHDRVSVLDGGLAAWTSAGGPLTTDPIAPPTGNFQAGPPSPEWPVIDKHAVRDRSKDALLLDARSADRYRGDSEPVDARPGHVPGAKSAPWSDNVKEGRFLAKEELHARYAALGAREASSVIAYCGSGVTACHDILALELAGFPHATLYEGSWSDWARDESLPAAQGDV